MKLVTDFGRYIRANVIERAKQLYQQKDGTWDDALREAYREARAQREAMTRNAA